MGETVFGLAVVRYIYSYRQKPKWCTLKEMGAWSW